MVAHTLKPLPKLKVARSNPVARSNKINDLQSSIPQAVTFSRKKELMIIERTMETERRGRLNISPFFMHHLGVWLGREIPGLPPVQKMITIAIAPEPLK